MLGHLVVVTGEVILLSKFGVSFIVFILLFLFFLMVLIDQLLIKVAYIACVFACERTSAVSGF